MTTRPQYAPRGVRVVGFALLTAALAGGCITAELPPAQTGCGADNPRIGQTAVLVAPPHCDLPLFDHDVSGTAEIVDDCTIVIHDFNYDGTALDARVAGIVNNDFMNPIMLTENLSPTGPYRGATLTVTLPEGVTLDDVRHIAVVCAPFRINFGDGRFE